MLKRLTKGEGGAVEWRSRRRRCRPGRCAVVWERPVPDGLRRQGPSPVNLGRWYWWQSTIATLTMTGALCCWFGSSSFVFVG